jgi:hypothetical protein
MPIFSCSNCGLALSTPDDRPNEDIVCPGCKKSQRAPTVAPNIVVHQPSPPGYVFPEIFAAILMFISVFAVIFGILMAMASGMAGIFLIAFGLMFLAIGMLLQFARIIARQTYRKLDD